MYADKVGVSYQTAHRWFKNGKIPGAYQIETGTVIVPDSAIPNDSKESSTRTKTVVYARVSSNEQRKTNRETQAERRQNFCTSNGWIVDSVVKEVGSGLNDERKKLLSIFKDPQVKRIVVEHRDRLTRFGFTTFKRLLKSKALKLLLQIKQWITTKMTLWPILLPLSHHSVQGFILNDVVRIKLML